MRVVRYCVLLVALAACAKNPQVARDGSLMTSPTVTVDAARADAYIELGPQIVTRSTFRRAVYDSLDALGRSRGEVRPSASTNRGGPGVLGPNPL